MFRTCAAALLMPLCFAAVAAAQAPEPAASPAATQPAPAPAPPTTPPADGKTAIKARVIELKGDVKWAPLDSSEWKAAKEGDEYPEQTKIMTGLRSSVKLQIGDEEPYTCMAIESAGKTIISEAYKTGDTKKVRVGVGYGRVKAGVAEGGLKSDFTVDSPVATLSKRGTWGFSLYYERDTNVFEIGLADFGLVQALSKITSERRNVSPGQLVTQAMRRWLDESQIQRNVAVADLLGQSDVDVAFNRIDNDGVGVTNPGGGRSMAVSLSNSEARSNFSQLADRALTANPITGGPTPPTGGSTVREEGFFGTGRGDQLIPILIEANNPLAQKGWARPGRYLFRRSALEGASRGGR